jgi:23S rRNA (cytosine1962-C5)-methyltransferase
MGKARGLEGGRKERIARLVVQEGSEAPLRGGHPWVYRDAVRSGLEGIPDGGEADVLDARGGFIGRGLVSSRSRIVCRICTRRREPLDEDFFRKRLAAAAEHRKAAGLPSEKTDSFRLVFAEADGVPGLVVDRFADVLVMQTPTAPMDQRKEMLTRLLVELFRSGGVCERNDMAVRKNEGLDPVRAWRHGEERSSVRIRENGLLYEVDPMAAMKTGHFFDQRETRRLLERVAAKKRVLDLFCYTGGFGLTAARAGAREVLSVDGSAGAIEAAQRNARLNGLDDRIEHRVADGFDMLRSFVGEKRAFDVVVLDPPAFAKSKTHLENALHAYKDINRLALRLLPAGGVLLTCSCSYHVGREAFAKMLLRAAGEARCLVRLLAEGRAGADHPVLVNIPETDYLKASLLQVVEKH